MPSSNRDSRTTPGAGSEPNHQARARARSHSYALFSRLFLSPVTPELLPYLDEIAELRAALPEQSDAEEMAADHHHLFAFNVFPYEAVFLDDSGLLGGVVTDEVRRRYQQTGYQVDASATSPDHIGHELGLLAFLCAAEADAEEDGERQDASRLRRLQSDFLQRHLLRWLSPLVLALRHQDHPLYERLGQVTLDVVEEHAADLVQGASMPPALPEAPDPLADEESGLSDIAHFLSTPPYSGLYLSRETISTLARGLDLPRGFGSREQLLLNTLRSAAQYEKLGNFLDALQALAEEWCAGYEAMDVAPLTAYAGVWGQRALATRNILGQMQTQVEKHTA